MGELILGQQRSGMGYANCERANIRLGEVWYVP